MVTLMKVGYELGGTTISPFNTMGTLFQNREIRQALAGEEEDGIFETLLLRELVDE